MYKLGHFGFTLLLSSLICVLFVIAKVITLQTFLLVCVTSAVFSYLPDVDQDVGLKHRGITHTCLFAVVCSIGLAVGVHFLNYSLYYSLLGGWCTFFAIAWHILIDLTTYERFKPWYPFSQKEHGGLKFWKASNKIANTGLAFFGIVVFVLLYTYLGGNLPVIIDEIRKWGNF
jgi:membrane-bound metal-dependent hydrolase YbcI (DUF457 family)